MRPTFVDAVAAYFTARAGQWIDGRSLATVGGAYAWRSRVSDCRKQGMTIENRVRTVYGSDGRRLFRVSEYQYVPRVDSGATVGPEIGTPQSDEL